MPVRGDQIKSQVRVNIEGIVADKIIVMPDVVVALILLPEKEK
jgi:hypothetical protein